MSKNQSLATVMKLTPGEVITLTGAGGKTTTLFQIAEELRVHKVLLSTTTKMWQPTKEQVDYLYSQSEMGQTLIVPKRGRTFLYGTILENGKCTAVSEELLERVATGYEYTVIEGDGSRGLPLKGYNEDEPCIPSFASLGVGIVTLKGLDKEANEKNVLRPLAFTQMTGMQPGEFVSEIHLARWLAHPLGLFKNSPRRKILLFNQVDIEKELETVKRILDLCSADFTKELERIIVGDVKKGEYEVLEGGIG
ncbi:putative selenium-dependent hydroxylase accessory protein YqeC [Lachnospiraceae bacterium PF1-21]|uniref:Selenium cofactor biosynthesis protein YqeC n=1 Tax=Ohessyouella blattaphilus TaxID=2949333 RepID=A0ABT1EKA5_9FIRM|nr:selenium cofactor biosynthesis protein YqeC [Ohessyouella blattaphilus]MCP1111134.1 selenium cofactor biosynthesis protein YqeC [Ohessyouella blattaphilus]MCR8564528.1 selenium cofactor biosynthesis protein YqeC [Ohessyouella blattaphilus]MDL2250221.1 putative selenium-dependent hydroxylase accessory protein YqeC [Lachnospiraceae bacterium OttesenSCG-928-J05]